MVRHPILRFLLPASLALNAFLAGVILVLWSGPHFPPPRPERMIEDMAATLPAADGQILQQSFAARAPNVGGRPRNREDMFERIRTALRAEPFDPAAMSLIFSEGRKVRDQIDDSIEAALVEAAGKMSAEGRRKLAEWRPPFPPPRR